jgi:hypothetical protein
MCLRNRRRSKKSALVVLVVPNGVAENRIRMSKGLGNKRHEAKAYSPIGI